MDQDAEINFPEDGHGDKYFCFTGFYESEKIDLARKVESLGGFVLRDVTWNDHCTHVISRTFEILSHCKNLSDVLIRSDILLNEN